MEDLIYLSAQNGESRRSAIVEDDGRAAWLILTEPGSARIVADCWLYNSVAAPLQKDFGRGETPVVPLTHTQYAKPFSAPPLKTVTFQWSRNGHSVAVLFDSDLMGFIADAQPRGYSKLLSVSGPYGAPLDRALYGRMFGATGHELLARSTPDA